MVFTAISVLAVMVSAICLIVLGSFSLVHGLVNSELAIGARAIWVALGFLLCMVAGFVINVPFPAGA